MAQERKKVYFTAGPAKIPAPVMERAHCEFLNYKQTDISVLEVSHRSKIFDAIIAEAESNLRQLLKIPDNYAVLFVGGGGRFQFDAVPMNLCCAPGKCSADYVVNGSWSKIAANDAEKYVQVHRQTVSFERAPQESDLANQAGACYRYYCDNETIGGVEFSHVPSTGNPIESPLVCDMTSNFLSRPIDVSKFGIIFAGAQKNCGKSGFTIVIVRRDLIGRHMAICPTLLRYSELEKNSSRTNTPDTYGIYLANLCFKYYLELGGLEKIDQINREKAALLYKLIDNSNGFYKSPVDVASRSRMNVVFLLPTKDLESKFLEEAQAAGLYELKGHRSVGGCRASIYNAISRQDVERLCTFMSEFQALHVSEI